MTLSSKANENENITLSRILNNKGSAMNIEINVKNTTNSAWP